MIAYKFPESATPHLVYVKDRPRNSGLTSVRWIDEERLVAADFNGRMIYIVSIKGGQFTILDQHATVISGGEAVNTDLMDHRDGLVVVSNFYQGSESYYSIEDNKIKFLREVNSNKFTNLHGVRFVPGTEDLLWKTYCGTKNRLAEIYNFKTNKLVHRFKRKEQLQDVAFVGSYAVMAGRTDHMSVGTERPDCTMYATLYLLKLPSDLHKKAPKPISEWRGEGHLDALKEYNGKVYAANQYTNSVDVFTIVDDRIVLEKKIEGFAMPHGLDIRPDGLMAVTNYEDQSLRLIPLT